MPTLKVLVLATVAFCSVAAERNPICHQPRAQGPCFLDQKAYYYDAETFKCYALIHGGCGGFESEFGSMKECEKTCEVEKCQLHKESGMCKASKERYYFDNGECKRFIYGGCGGNANNFRSLEKCESCCLIFE